MKKIKVKFKLVEYAFYLFLTLAVISYIISSVNVRKGQQYLPTVFGLTGVTIRTGSMAPMADVGDYVVIKNPKIDEIKVGDIITFADNEILVTHRVEEIINEDGAISFLTKGDANNTTDKNLVLFENVVGRSVMVIPKLGSILTWMNTTNGLITVGTIILLICIIPSKKSKTVAIGTNDEVKEVEKC